MWVSSNCAGWCVQGCATAPCCLAPCQGSCPLPWQKQRVLHAPLQKPGAGCLCPYQGWCKWLHQMVLGVFSNLDDSKTHLRLQLMRAFCTAKPHSLRGCIELCVPFGCAALPSKATRPNTFVMSRSASIALISQGGWHPQGFASRSCSAQGST